MTRAVSADLVLAGVRLDGVGHQVDVAVAEGVITSVTPHGVAWVPESSESKVLDLSDHLLLPAAAEPHGHLDKTMLYERACNPTGDLAGAIRANREHYASTTPGDIHDRAIRALGVASRRGFTFVRSHVNVESGCGTEGLRVLRGLADEVSGAMDVELVALIGFPLTGPEGKENRALLTVALSDGADVVGGAPSLDANPPEAIRILCSAAAEAGLPIDLHLDETLDPDSRSLEAYVEEVARLGLGGRAVASHCVSLGQQDEVEARRTARQLADVGVCVVTLPQTNLVLQAGEQHTRVPRGTTPVRLLSEEGVVVAAGGDNWRDMFNPLGRIDPFETAALMVAVHHLSPSDAYSACSTTAWGALGRAIPEIALGAPAELLAIRASATAEAVAGASEERTVIHRGRVASRTAVQDLEPTMPWRPSRHAHQHPTSER